MKKIVFLFSTLLLMSCAGVYRQASYATNHTYIGMPISEFKATVGRKASVEAMESGYTVYRMNDYESIGVISDTKFFYFDSNGKLYKIDGGEFKQERYQIEVK
jgi:hypothetical protein